MYLLVSNLVPLCPSPHRGNLSLPSGAISEELGSVEDGYPANRFNDAKCDSYGRLWAGTYSLADPSVKDRGCGLYSISNGKYLTLKNGVEGILSLLCFCPAMTCVVFVQV